jgi:hypothetical protein
VEHKTRRATQIPIDERWQAARARAMVERIVVFQVESTGQWVASSGTKPGKGYAIAVQGNRTYDCDCDAGKHGDEVCKHRAAFYEQIGAFSTSIRDAVRETHEKVRADARKCMWCHGTGKTQNVYHQRYDDCDACNGTGIKPSLSRRRDDPREEIATY